MPVLPVESMVADLSESDERIVRAAFTTRGVCRLRANKPFKKVETFEQGCANYVWRMLCFDLAGFGKHVCMPVCADFEISDAQATFDGGRIRYGQEGYNEQSNRAKELRKRMDELVKRVESVLPIESKKGLLRWGVAFGMIR